MMAISGITNKEAPMARASSCKRKMLSRFPVRSPTSGSGWPKRIFKKQNTSPVSRQNNTDRSLKERSVRRGVGRESQLMMEVQSSMASIT